MKEIPLNNSQLTAIVDDEDYELLMEYEWALMPDGSVATFIYFWTGFHKTAYMHRVILNAPKGIHVDHRHHNKRDNRKSEIRLATQGQNTANMKVFRPGKTSRFKGVCWDKRGKRWLCYITVNYVRLHLGSFQDEVKAGLAYNEAAKKHFGEFACLNPI